MIKIPLKLCLIFAWLCLCFPLLWLANKARKISLRNRIYTFGSAGIAAIIGLRVHVVGEVTEARPLMLVSNHISYLDILVLGANTPARFTPKRDMAAWPVISWICNAAGCIYVERKPEKIKETSGHIKTALATGEVISLFPEATTGNGRHVLPFKSGFFSLAEEDIGGKSLLVQPAVISYTRIGRLPIDSRQWPRIAWYGDMTLAPHFLKMLTLGRIDVTLTLLPPIPPGQFTDRKQLAAHCQALISDTLEQGRRPSASPHGSPKPH